MTSTNSTPYYVTPSTSAPSSRPGTPTLSTPSSIATSDKPQDDSSKLKIFLGLLKKVVGVADIAAVRFSLPANLMEPIPNLEYWHYLDRPDTFTSIGKSDDDVGRMLEVLRFWFTKDLKYVKGKPCKPYNSTLGEFFRCNWELADDAPSISSPQSTTAQPPTDPLAAPESGDADPVRISYITEQTSHHPPVSAYWVECPERGLVARGYDQISAKFTGTTVRVQPGQFNAGIFIKLQKRDDEEYQLTHPTANLAGLLKGSLYISVSDTCYITCPKTKLKVVLTYVEEGWFGRAKNQVKGVVFKYDPKNDKPNKITDISEKDIVARVEGCWTEQIFYSLGSAVLKNERTGEFSKDKKMLIDLTPLMPVPKIVPPPEQQLPNESRELWKDVTSAILDKRYPDATKFKQDIEQRQRDKAADRQKNNTEWKPRFFTKITDSSGMPELSAEGRTAIDGMLKKEFDLKPSDNLGA